MNMKKMTTIAFALTALAALAMPTKEDMAEAQSIVNELMKDHVAANKKGKESNVAVGDAAMALAKDAQGDAAKLLLLKGAVTYYARGKEYEKCVTSHGLIALYVIIRLQRYGVLLGLTDSFLTVDETVLLNKDFLFVEIFSELRGGTPFMLAEQTVEIRERVETAVVTYFGYHFSRIYQHSRSNAQTNLDNIFRQCAACTLMKEAGKCDRCHPCQFCKLLQAHFFAEMTCNILLYFVDAAAVAVCLDACKRGTG